MNLVVKAHGHSRKGQDPTMGGISHYDVGSSRSRVVAVPPHRQRSGNRLLCRDTRVPSRIHSSRVGRRLTLSSVKATP